VKDHFNQIRQLLDEVEEQTSLGAPLAEDRSFSALELPLIIQEIVDDLQPLLTAYQAAFYWYLFRDSIARNGNPLLRMSTAGMKEIIRNSRGGGAISRQQVQDTLTELQSVGAIRKEGEPNREGTLYRIFIPDEIEACRKLRAERTAAEPKAEVSERSAPLSPIADASPAQAGSSMTSMEATGSVATAVALEPEPVVEPANDDISLDALRNAVLTALEEAGQQVLAHNLEEGEWLTRGGEVTVKVGMSQVLIDVALGAEPKRIIQASLSQAA